MNTQSLIVGLGASIGNRAFCGEFSSVSSRKTKIVRVKRRRFFVEAKVRKVKKHDYPWPDKIDPNDTTINPLTHLSHFKPLVEKPKPVTLAFEKPLVDLEQKIIEVQRMADETGLDFSSQIDALEHKYKQALKDLYTHLTPIQRLTIARHPNRPTALDHILNITDKWIELHGDRAGYDDPAIVTGIGSVDGKSYMFIAHQKGRNTKENIARNFAMPTPHGYRKALRMMKYADHHGFPIVTFVDTPGAFADLKSEELGQGEAIAFNLRTMFGMKVPIISIVTGEGGSGGALAIACANKLYMLENSAFYVASPEACAAILWKSSKAAPKAAEKLRITALEHYKLKIADGIIPEPLGGAHADPAWTSQQIKLVINQAMEELTKMETEELLRHRMLKFRSIGGFQEGKPVESKRKRNMKPSEVNEPKTDDIEQEIKILKKMIVEAKGPSDLIVTETIEKLKQDLDKEITNAFISMGLQERVKSVKLEISKSPKGSLNRELKEKVDAIMEDFNRNLSRPGEYLGLKMMLEKLDIAAKMVEAKKLKALINQKIPSDLRAKIKLLKESAVDLLDKGSVEEAERAKRELMEVLRSVDLEIVGVTKREVSGQDRNLAEKTAELGREIFEEIEKVIVSQSGLSEKIEELKANRAKGLSSKEIERVETEIKEEIVACLERKKLKEKAESLRIEMEGKIGAENGRV